MLGRTSRNRTPGEPVSSAHRRLLLAAAVMSFILVAIGGVVCVTDASGGCPDWPQCHGRFVPPARMDSVLEWVHRVLALLTGPLLLAAAIAGWWRRETALRVLPIVAVLLAAAVAIFGRFAVLTGLPPVLAAMDLGSALGVVSLTIIAALVASVASSGRPRTGGARRGPVATLAIGSLAALFIFQVAGVLLAQGSTMRCIGGALFSGSSSTSSGLATARAVLGGVTAVLVAATVLTALVGRSVEAATRRWSFAAGGLLCVEVALAIAILAGQPSVPLLATSALVAAALWCCLIVIATRATLLESAAVAGRLRLPGRPAPRH